MVQMINKTPPDTVEGLSILIHDQNISFSQKVKKSNFSSVLQAIYSSFCLCFGAISTWFQAQKYFCKKFWVTMAIHKDGANDQQNTPRHRRGSLHIDSRPEFFIFRKSEKIHIFKCVPNYILFILLILRSDFHMFSSSKIFFQDPGSKNFRESEHFENQQRA